MKYLSFLFLLSLAIFAFSASGDFHKDASLENQLFNYHSKPDRVNNDSLLVYSSDTVTLCSRRASLETVLQSMEEYQYEYFVKEKSDSKQKYEKAYHKFKILLEELRVEGLTPDILQDTMMMDIAKFYLMDSVILDLRELGFVERKSVPPDTLQEIKQDDFYKFTGRVFSNILGEVYSNRFESLYYYNPDGNHAGYKYIPGFGQYHPLSYANKFKHFQNYEIAIIPDDGFEGITHIVTIWEKNNDTYSLKFILDRLINEAIGGVDLDTIIEIDKNRNLLIGTSFGGDAGDTWGSVWVGVWELPRDLKVVYRKFWADTQDEHTRIEYSLENRKEIIVIEKSYNEEWRDQQFVILDSTIRRKTILIDSLLGLDHIRRSY